MYLPLYVDWVSEKIFKRLVFMLVTQTRHGASTDFVISVRRARSVGAGRRREIKIAHQWSVSFFFLFFVLRSHFHFARRV